MAAQGARAVPTAELPLSVSGAQTPSGWEGVFTNTPDNLVRVCGRGGAVTGPAHSQGQKADYPKSLRSQHQPEQDQPLCVHWAGRPGGLRQPSVPHHPSIDVEDAASTVSTT